MTDRIPLLDKSAAEKPICLPENPYIASLKSFGADEILAGVIDAFATTGVDYILDPELKTIILPFVGPTIEKLGFFPLHFKKAHEIYSTVPPNKRKSKWFYRKQAIKDGTSNLIKDLTIHDPLYVSFMSLGLSNYPEIPPGIMSAFSYISSILLVGAIDVAKDESKFKHKKHQLKKAGFGIEKYFESRFCILAEKDQEKLLDKIASEFKLDNIRTNKYHDTYFENDFPTYSGRTVRVRLRDRENTDYEREKFSNNNSHVKSLQIVYTRAREEKNGIDQYRYFPVRKEKLYLLLDDTIETINDIPSEKAKSLLLKNIKEGTTEVYFERTIANTHELAVCTDKVKAKDPYYILEFKTYDNIKMLQQAMRYVMAECPVVSVQTTYSKYDMRT